MKQTMTGFAMFALLAVLSPSRLEAAELRDIVGVSHIGGHYSFKSWPVTDGSKRDYLNEGADEILALGSRVIKVEFNPNPKAFYWYTANPNWAGPATYVTPEYRLVELAKQPQYVALFNKPFTTFVLNIKANLKILNPDGSEDVGRYSLFWPVMDGMTDAEKSTERLAMQNLATYLYQTYGGSGKTFILAHGEGDWIMRDFKDPAQPLSTFHAQAMRDWLNARQQGVTTARQLAGTGAGMKVVHASEVNFVLDAMNNNGITMTNDVLPYTNCDLYSYTIWESGPDRSPETLYSVLNYLQLKAPDSALYGSKNIYIGEFGSAENADDGGDGELQKEKTRRLAEVAIGFGCPYMLVWEIYCNEPVVPLNNDIRPTNSQMRGFWLVRPDGTHAPVYAYVQSLMSQSITHSALQAASGSYVSADDAGGGLVHVNAPWIKEWEYLTILDRNGGALVSGDPISVLTHNGHYFMAWDNGGGAAEATSTHGLAWEQFTIIKQSGTGAVVNGNSVAIRAGSGHYFVAVNGGGGSSLLAANSATAGTFERFTILVQP